jgi:hypothetical protein
MFILPPHFLTYFRESEKQKMIIHIKILPLLLTTILCLCVQSACTRAAPPATLAASNTPMPPSQTVSLPLSPSLTATATPTPTLTPSPTSTPTALSTKLYKPLPTVVTPLDDQQRATYIQNLLTTNGGCTLPCLLGVIPGQSSWEEVQRFFTSLGESVANTDHFPKYGLTDYFYSFQPPSNNLEALEWSVGFYVSGNEIDLFRFGIGSPARNPVYSTRYSVKAITAALGEPTKIEVSILILSNPRTAISYLLYIYYHVNDMWLVFKYPGFVNWLDNYETLVFCPTHPYLDNPGTRLDDSLTMVIQLGDELYSGADFRNLGIDLVGGVSFKKATGEEVKSFYQKMMAAKPDEKVCFTSKASVWGPNVMTK